VRVQNFILDSRTSSANEMSRASLGKLEHAQMGATSASRNPQPYYLATETTEYLFFRWISH